jgi:hypothetical protein
VGECYYIKKSPIKLNCGNEYYNKKISTIKLNCTNKYDKKKKKKSSKKFDCFCLCKNVILFIVTFMLCLWLFKKINHEENKQNVPIIILNDNFYKSILTFLLDFHFNDKDSVLDCEPDKPIESIVLKYYFCTKNNISIYFYIYTKNVRY